MIRKSFTRAVIPLILKPTFKNMLISTRPLFLFTTNKSDEGTHPDFQVKTKAPAVKKTSEEVQKEIDEIVKGHQVVLFMKGVPQNPMCGYSNYAVEVLKFYQIKNYYSVDILKDAQMREEVKKYSNWPTYPQLYVNGQLVGGCDIMTEMHKDGSLKQLFQSQKQ